MLTCSKIELNCIVCHCNGVVTFTTIFLLIVSEISLMWPHLKLCTCSVVFPCGGRRSRLQSGRLNAACPLSSDWLRFSPPSGRVVQPGGQVCRHGQGAHHPPHAADGGPVWHLQPCYRPALQHLQHLRTRGEYPSSPLGHLGTFWWSHCRPHTLPIPACPHVLAHVPRVTQNIP